MCIRQRIGGSNPPLTAIFKKELVRKYGLFFHIKPPYRGGENHRPGFDTKTPGAFLNRACSGPEGARPRDGLSSGAASWTDRARSERAAPKGRAKRVNPPLTAIFKLRACTEVRAFCLYVSPKLRGDENHRPGFDTKTPGAFLNRACSGPEGARPRDGLSSGAASWTNDEPARRLPEGRAQRVNPPSPPYLRKSSYESTGFFSHYPPSITG